MRPVNLIPAEQRGFRGGVARTGPLLYIILGSLGVLLIGVVMLVLTSNKISDREGEIRRLDVQKAVVTANAARLASYVSFEKVAEERIAGVTRLAEGRFDWVRVIHQLSLILPPGSSIENLTASSGGGSEGGPFAVSVPAMSLAGCTSGQDQTAAVIAALKQIDGVTRVGLANSSISGSGEEGESECTPGQAQFELTASFDEAPQSLDVPGAEVVAPEPAPSGSSTETSTEEPSEEEGGESIGETASAGGTEGAG